MGYCMILGYSIIVYCIIGYYMDPSLLITIVAVCIRIITIQIIHGFYTLGFHVEYIGTLGLYMGFIH